MNESIASSPEVRTMPQAEPSVEHALPLPNPLRELQALAEAFRTDWEVAPGEYLEEVWVPGGGE